jgi:hypothetical protein
MIRLREKLGEKLLQVYHDDRVFSCYHIHDDKEIAIQVLTHPEQPGEVANKYLIMVKQWNPETWCLSPPREVWVNKSATLGELAKVLG